MMWNSQKYSPATRRSYQIYIYPSASAGMRYDILRAALHVEAQRRKRRTAPNDTLRAALYGRGGVKRSQHHGNPSHIIELMFYNRVRDTYSHCLAERSYAMAIATF